MGPRWFIDSSFSLSFCVPTAVCQVPDDEVSAGEVEGLVSEADAYSLASHLLWAIWSLLQSKVGDGRLAFFCASASPFTRSFDRYCVHQSIHSTMSLFLRSCVSP